MRGRLLVVLSLALVLLAAIAVLAAPIASPASIAPASPAFATSRPPSPGVTVTPTPGAPAPIPDGYRLQIPRLGIDLPIQEGIVQRDVDQQQTPEGAAFHLPGTSVPGKGGNTYLYAHARRGMFISLWEARVGDEVFVSTPDRRALVYVVAQVHPRIAPNDVSWVQATDGERLTLQTSTGPNPSDPRFVVIAVPKT